MWSIHIQTEIEKQGIPAAAIITTPFINDAQSAADLYGVPAARKVVLPHPIAYTDEEELYQKVEKAYGDLISCLTAPLTEDEQRKGLKKALQRKRILIENVPVEKAHQYFSEMGLSDGLPVIPPTEEKVKEMLKGTSHSPDEVIGLMPPEKWKVTVEKVAINGVMAGCLPEHMPVLLALAEALIDPRTGTETFTRSTTSFAFWAMVNGPIAKQIGMNSGLNALGPGNIANSTIGRAIRLFIINLGGSSPGVNDMSSLGNPLKFGFAFAENEEESPWEPYHVTRGFKPEESTITVFKAWGSRNTSLNGVKDRGVGLKNMAWTAQTVGAAGGRGIVILMDPLLAKQIASEGISKQDVQQYMWQSLRWSVSEWKESMEKALIRGFSQYPKWYEQLEPEATIPLFPSAECIQVVVAGGQTNPFYQIYDGVGNAEGTTISVDKWR